MLGGLGLGGLGGLRNSFFFDAPSYRNLYEGASKSCEELRKRTFAQCVNRRGNDYGTRLHKAVDTMSLGRLGAAAAGKVRPSGSVPPSAGQF